MRAKKAVARVKSHGSLSSEQQQQQQLQQHHHHAHTQATQRYTLVVEKGAGEAVCSFVIELCSSEAPKACEAFVQNVAVTGTATESSSNSNNNVTSSSNGNNNNNTSNSATTAASTSKARAKQQGVYRRCPFRRLTRQALQTGEVAPPPPRTLTLAELEGEVGAVAHGRGTVSLCRYAAAHDAAQFFVCLTNDADELAQMNTRYVAFARVVDGMGMLDVLTAELDAYVGDDGVIAAHCPYVLADVVAL